MAKPRVHEIAAQYGVTSKQVLETMRGMGEFVKGPSSSMPAPVARRVSLALREGGAELQVPAIRLPAASAARGAALLPGLPRSLPDLVDLLVAAAEEEPPAARQPPSSLILDAALSRRFFFAPADAARPIRNAGAAATHFNADLLPSPSGLAFVEGSDGNAGEIIAWHTREDLLYTGSASVYASGLHTSGHVPKLSVSGMVVVAIDLARARDHGHPRIGDREARPLVGLLMSVPERPGVPVGTAERRTPAAAAGPNSREGVQLRYMARGSSGVRGEPSGAIRSAHWQVRGHWRNQWYPSRGEHGRLWIPDHVAGHGDTVLGRRDLVLVIRPGDGR